WLESQRKKISEKADKELNEVNHRIDLARIVADNADADVRRFEQEHNINPEDYKGGSGAMISRKSDEKFNLQEKMSTARAHQKGLQTQYEAAEAEVDNTPKFKTVKGDLGTVPGLAGEVKKAQALVAHYTIALQYITPNHPDYANFQANLHNAQAKLDEIEKITGAAAGG